MGDHFKGLVAYVNVLTFRHLPRACHLFWQGSGPVYVVIANMKLVALLCIGFQAAGSRAQILQNCVNWDGLRSPYLFDWINLDICGILWLWYTEQINPGCRCSHVSDLLWAVAFFAMASLDGLLQHRETLWHETYDTSSACCFSVSFFGGRLHICAMVKRWIICLYLNILYILSMYLIYNMYNTYIYILWFCMIMSVYINPLYT